MNIESFTFANDGKYSVTIGGSTKIVEARAGDIIKIKEWADTYYLYNESFDYFLERKMESTYDFTVKAPADALCEDFNHLKGGTWKVMSYKEIVLDDDLFKKFKHRG